jgi:protein-S-isoprenylcysteine O-methyltransferase Ste14
MREEGRLREDFGDEFERYRSQIPRYVAEWRSG